MGLAACLLGSVLSQTAEDTAIKSLPGYPAYKGGQYSGYMTVNEEGGRALFYWFVESANTSSDDLVIWLNGGPGCSSLGGLMTELGPQYPNVNGTGLYTNQWAWTNVADVIFVESPAGVGFSYSNDTSFYDGVGDNQTSADLYAFIQGFLQRYPSYQEKNLWIAGESYGGHYVPQTAWEFVTQNDRVVAGNPSIPGAVKLNFRGFLVGNAWTVPAVDNLGAAFDWWSHGLVSDEAFFGLVATCNFSDTGPIAAKGRGLSSTGSTQGFSPITVMAQAGLEAAQKAGHTFPLSCNEYQSLGFTQQGNINIYEIYADVCIGGGNGPLQVRNSAAHFLKALGREVDLSDAHTGGRRLAGDDNAAGGYKFYEPCIDGATQKYLNTPEVQEAIHAHDTAGVKWSDCSSLVQYSTESLYSNKLPVYEYLISRAEELDMRFLVYSGDIDAIVPIPGTRAWLDLLNQPIEDPWKPWLCKEEGGQVGGYVQVYEGSYLTFASVRGAGHMVPGTQPARSLQMFSNFLNDIPIGGLSNDDDL